MSTIINAFDNFYGSLDSSQKQKLIEHIINEHIKVALEGYDSGALVVLKEGANSNMRCDSLKSLMIINKLSKFL